jgi:hypothetical protein
MTQQLIQNVKHNGKTSFVGDPVPNGVDLEKHPQLVARPLTDEEELAAMEEAEVEKARLEIRKKITAQREANKAAERKASSEADKAKK